TVTCAPSETFTGSVIAPCTVAVAGVGGLNETPAPNYSNNMNVGTATASYSFTGDANHAASSDSKTFAITPAASTTTVSCAASATIGRAASRDSAETVSGAGGLSQTPAASYTNNRNVGTATASYRYTGNAIDAASSGEK